MAVFAYFAGPPYSLTVIEPGQSAASFRQFRFHIKTFRSGALRHLFCYLSENLMKILYLHFQDKSHQRLRRQVRAGHLFRFHLSARSAACQKSHLPHQSSRCHLDRIVPDQQIHFRWLCRIIHCRH